MAETETQTETQKQHDLIHRKIDFVPNSKPFKGFSKDFHIETLNPTITSEQRQLVCVNGTSHPPPKKHDGSEFSEFGLDPELNFGITFRRIVSFCFIFNFLYNLISLHSSSFGR
jgi:ubiquitin carboxyl-terminal hydrolase 36/42